MPKPGRPQVLTEKKKAEILAILSTGCGRGTAAAYVRCALKTIANTARRDPEFAANLAQRENSPEIAHLTNLNRAGKDERYWRASAWTLERMFPQKYGVRPPDSITPEQLSVLMTQVAEMIVREITVARVRKRVIASFGRLLLQTKKLLALK
jgi:hypothetical protein